MDTYLNVVSYLCLLTFLAFANCNGDDVTSIPTIVESGINATTLSSTIKEIVEESGLNAVSSSSTNSPESVGPSSRPYYRNFMRVSSVRRTGRMFNGGENTLESPIRPTAPAQEYPRGTGVGSFAEVGMAITKTAYTDNRNGRSYQLGATEASVSGASLTVTSLVHLTLPLLVLAIL